MEQAIRRYRSDRELTRCGQLQNGIYCSRRYRGLRAGMEWMRLSLTVSEPVLVKVYTTDEESAGAIDRLEPVLERTASDLILYGVQGLFLRFTVEPGAALQAYELAFPGLSIDSLLPSVMQGDGTLRKLLGVYQSLYMDLNRELSAFPERLDPLGPDPLPELHRWLGASSWMGLGLPDQALLATAAELNRLRGTKKGLLLLAELVTGQGCEIVERFQWDNLQSAQERDDCARLYGPGRAGVTLLFPSDASKQALPRLNAVLHDFIPLGVPYAVVRLEEGAELDGHSCLDSGVRITDPPSAELDGPEAGDLVLE